MKSFNSSKFPITPITDESSYLAACELVENLDEMLFENETDEQKKYAHLDAITTLITAYESKNFNFNSVKLTINQVLEQALEQLNLTKKDLSKMLGSNRVSEIFYGKRNLSLAQIRILHRELRIPTDILVGV